MIESKYTCPIHKDVTFDEIGKCPKCINIEKKARDFKKDPDDFVRLSDLILAAKLDGKGKMMTLVNQGESTDNLHLAYGYLSEKYRLWLTLLGSMKRQESKSKIIQAAGVAPYRNIKKG